MSPALDQLGWDQAWADACSVFPVDPRLNAPGRVLRVDRGRLLVGTAGGETRHVDHPAPGRTVDPEPVTGDWVLLDSDAVTAVLPRRSALVRGAGRKDARAQVLAANVDVVLVVMGLSSAPNLSRLDRLLAVAWESGGRPVVVLTKADLAPSAQTEAEEVAEHAPGVSVHLVSAVDGRGLDGLRAELGERSTMVLLGASGAGKSSLVNALAGQDLLEVGEIRDDGKGRHTTTSRHLVPVPGLGVLIDTPGVRGVQLWDADEGLARTFADIEELAESCRYADCRHEGEPDCAVQAAVEAGTVSPARLESMRKLHREVAFLQARHDARLRAERRKEWKSITKQMRGHGRP